MQFFFSKLHKFLSKNEKEIHKKYKSSEIQKNCRNSPRAILVLSWRPDPPRKSEGTLGPCESQFVQGYHRSLRCLEVKI